MLAYKNFGIIYVALAGIACTTMAAPFDLSNSQAQLVDGFTAQDLHPTHDQLPTLVESSVKITTEETTFEGE
jgi:hypothetical protein